MRVEATAVLAMFAAHALSLCLPACGNPSVVSPEPLAILDTRPGNGSLVPPGETEIVILFSSDVDVSTLATGIRLENVTSGGTPIEEVKATYQSYAAQTRAAVYTVEPLPAASTFRMTMKKDVLRSTSGLRLRADFVRSFRTTP